MYKVELPEDAALLTVAWLARVGDRAAALELIETIAPLADQLRFAPKVTKQPAPKTDCVYRITAGEARANLDSKQPPRQIEAQREALGVWAPFADQVLNWWLQMANGVMSPDPGWLSAGSVLLSDYQALAKEHTLCGKHRNPKENLGILLRALDDIVHGRTLSARSQGLVRQAVRSMVAKRGLPGSPQHAAIRRAQATVAAAPTHAQVASLASERLSNTDPDVGITDLAQYTVPAQRDESVLTGTPVPNGVYKTLQRAWAAPIQELHDAGLISSAEVLAELVPQISAGVVAKGFSDSRLGLLASANYRAFRARRSLLLLDLNKQVQIGELPWVRAVAGYRHSVTSDALAVARQVGSYALEWFPGTILPSPLVQELNYLLREAGKPIALVEELAADIFMGAFSDKFRVAALTADQVLRGSLYDRYYGIDYAGVAPLLEQPSGKKELSAFSLMCWQRSGQKQSEAWSPACNGMVLEQAQILTTHNLAALAQAGVTPEKPWDALAVEALDQAATQLRAAATRRRLPSIKNAAYAWRQAIFFLSMTPESIGATLAIARDNHAGSGVMMRLLADLAACVDGESTRPFLGWTTEHHWIWSYLGSPH